MILNFKDTGLFNVPLRKINYVLTLLTKKTLVYSTGVKKFSESSSVSIIVVGINVKPEQYARIVISNASFELVWLVASSGTLAY